MPAYANLTEKQEWIDRPPRLEMESAQLVTESSLLVVLYAAITMILIGFFALRMAGRKSLSKMTISQAVIMIAVGSILIEPVKRAADGGIIETTLAIISWVFVLWLLEYLILKFPAVEKLLIGTEKTVIENGEINYKSLKKLRMTERQLAALLREKGIYKFSEVETATLETNGELGAKRKEREGLNV